MAVEKSKLQVEDFFSFVFILDSLLSRKSVIIFTLLSVLAPTYIFLKYFPQKYNGKAEIIQKSRNIDSSLFGLNELLKVNIYNFYYRKDFFDYRKLNDKESISLVSGNIIRNNPASFNSEKLLGDFVDFFQDRKALSAAILKFGEINQTLVGTARLKKTLLARRLDDYKLTRARANRNKGEGDPIIYDLDVETINVSETINILQEARLSIFNDVNSNLISEYEGFINSLDQKLNFEISSLRSALQSRISEYRTATKAKLKFLEEQAAIARELNIEVGTSAQTTGQRIDTTSQEQSANLETIYYLRGYRAIEKEISLIKQRKPEDELQYVPDYPSMIAKLTELENNSSIAELRNLLKNLPAFDNRFPPVVFDVDRMEFYRKLNPVALLAGATTAGLLLGMFLAWFLSVLQHRKAILQKDQMA